MIIHPSLWRSGTMSQITENCDSSFVFIRRNSLRTRHDLINKGARRELFIIIYIYKINISNLSHNFTTMKFLRLAHNKCFRCPHKTINPEQNSHQHRTTQCLCTIFSMHYEPAREQQQFHLYETIAIAANECHLAAQIALQDHE